MSSVQHQATVDKGLKMKIKRKNVGVSKDGNKHEVIKSENKQGDTSQSANGMLADKTSQLSLVSDKEKSPKSKGGYCKKDKSGKAIGKTAGEGCSNGVNSSVNGVDPVFGQTMEPRAGELPSVKKENVPDPYEFNAKVEDGLSSSMPMKKIKMEKVESAGSSQAVVPSNDVSTETNDVGVVTEPECLGPCEPGTSVTLGGIVWHESETGVLVVNVTWRGKTYVGTLLDATRHDWAPPRFNCDSPVSEFETRTPKGRGKRRAASSTPVNDTRVEGRKLRKGRRGSNVNTFQAPPSPAKSDVSSSGGVKRKGRPQDIDLSCLEGRTSKRSRSGSQVPTPSSECPSPTLIECPEPNCNKKYKHINGLRYHQSHAHQGNSAVSSTPPDEGKDMDVEESAPSAPQARSSRKEKESNVSKKESVAAAAVAGNKKDKESKDSGQTDKAKGSDGVSTPKKEEQKAETPVKEVKDLVKDSKLDTVKVDSPAKKKDLSSNSSAAKSLSQTVTTSSSAKPSVSQTPTKNVPSSGVLPVSVSSSAPPTSLPAVSAASTSQSSSLATGVSSTSLTYANKSPLTSSMPISVSTVPNVPVQSVAEKNSDLKIRTTMEARTAKTTRPIVPAPSPQMIASVQVTHTNLTPVMTHAQMSPQLKPIQPKPTILGEPQNINPVLAEFKDIRKKNQRKRPKEGAAPNGNGSGRPEQPKQAERTGVIKANPLPNKPADQAMRKEGPASKESPRSDSSRPSPVGGQQNKGMDLSQPSRLGQGSSLLKVSSPLQVATPENRKTPVTDDVQSPAYSDISDANESASPAAQSGDSPQKQKDESAAKKEKSVDSSPAPPSETSSMASHYGMYSYYGQSPYHMNNLSPSQVSQGASQQKPGGPSQHAHPMGQSSKDPNKPSGAAEAEKKRSKEEVKLSEKRQMEDKPSSAPGKGKPEGGNGGPPGNMSQQQMHEYQMQQQKWYQQAAVYMQSLPPQMQYPPYMSNGWYPMDPGYMQQYEKMMEEQRRLQAEQQGKSGDRAGAGPSGPSGAARPEEGRKSVGPRDRPQDLNKGPSGSHQMPSSKRDNDGPMSGMPLHSKHSPSSLPQGSGAGSDKSEAKKSLDGVSVSMKSSEKDLKEQALRDKQNENHQILKENIDLKAEMDKTRHEQSYERYRKAEELRRFQMFHEQKMIEERKKLDLVRKSDTSSIRPENLTTKAPGTKPIVEHSASSRSRIPGHDDIVAKDHSKKDSSDSKGKESHSRESSHSRDGAGRDSSESSSKHSDMKSAEDKSKTPISDKHRTHETPKQRQVGSSSKTGSPSIPLSSSSSAPSNIPGSPSYSPYMNNYPFMPSQQYGHMGVDPSHPLYRGHSVSPAMLPGYPSGNYIHPSQMAGYRVGSEEEKEKAVSKGLPPSSDIDPKKLSDSSRSGSQYYGNVHKIHELSEKGMPRSRGSSPAPVKSSSSENSSSVPTSAFDKHREYSSSPPTQRHVHTHHHTHVVGLQPTPVPSFTPVYDAYGAAAMFAGQAQSPSSIPHPFPSK